MQQFLTVALFAVLAGHARAQQSGPGVTFEAISIKPFPEGTGISMGFR